VALAAALEDVVTFFLPMVLESSLSSFWNLGAVAMASGKQGGKRAMEQGRTRLTLASLL
jgi:hypothetical protein